MNTRSMGFILLAGILLISSCSDRSPLSSREREAMVSVHREYSTVWKSGNPDRVMDLFTHDPVIVPSGMDAIEGTDAVREYWWPEGGGSKTVTSFEMSQDESGGFGDLGYIRGSFSMSYTYEGELHTQRGEYVSLLRNTDDGWKISHHMWNDKK